jgi:hypothetical protein
MRRVCVNGLADIERKQLFRCNKYNRKRAKKIPLLTGAVLVSECLHTSIKTKKQTPG